MNTLTQQVATKIADQSILGLCNSYRRKSLLCLIVISFFYCFFKSNAKEPERLSAFKAQGEIVYEIALPSGILQHWNRHFTVVVDACDWQIESVDMASGQYALKIRRDGLIHNVNAVSRTNATANDYSMLVEDQDVPGSDMAGISAIWLAYGSKCYLHAVTNGQFEPIWMLDDPRLRKEDFKMSGVLTPLESGLPEQLVYLNKGVIYARSPAGNRAIIRAPATFPGAVTNAIYRVIETTNIGTIKMPKSFEFIRYGIRPDFTTYFLARIAGTINAVSQIRTGQIGEEVPDLKGIVFVQDTRFARNGVGELRYHTTNLTFLASTNPSLLRQKKVTEFTPSDRKNKSTKQTAVRIIIIASAILPAIWFLLRRFRKIKL